MLYDGTDRLFLTVNCCSRKQDNVQANLFVCDGRALWSYGAL